MPDPIDPNSAERAREAAISEAFRTKFEDQRRHDEDERAEAEPMRDTREHSREMAEEARELAETLRNATEDARLPRLRLESTAHARETWARVLLVT